MRKWLFLLGLASCVPVPPPYLPPAPATPVRYLHLGSGGRCSAVVLNPLLAVTAAHCLDTSGMFIDWIPVRGYDLGHDLATLDPGVRELAPPYAALGTLGPDLEVEGWGCNVTRRSLRKAVRPIRSESPGLEIQFDGRVCPGDSGGALWSGGKLVGVLTAQSGPAYGYATVLQ